MRRFGLITAVALSLAVFTPWHASAAGCTNPTADVGTTIYNADYDAFEGCSAVNGWVAFFPPGYPSGGGGGGGGSGTPTGCTNPGDVCSDGTVYAGLSSDGNVKMYTTPADAPSTYTWNNGSTNWVDTSMANCTGSSGGSCDTGQANTTLLVGLSDAASPYAAAVYCHGLSTGGHSDWYLPALSELNVLYTNHAAIGGFNTSGSWYWSSSEYSNVYARIERFSDGGQTYYIKHSLNLVRCVRR